MIENLTLFLASALMLSGLAGLIAQATTGSHMARVLAGASLLFLAGLVADHVTDGSIPRTPKASATILGLVAGLLTVAFWR